MALPEPQEQLCFSPEELLNSDFQVDDFVSRCRKRATMEGLREELHSYFKTLKSAMVELINKDYADFVNLSANLVNHLNVQLLLFTQSTNYELTPPTVTPPGWYRQVYW